MRRNRDRSGCSLLLAQRTPRETNVERKGKREDKDNPKAKGHSISFRKPENLIIIKRRSRPVAKEESRGDEEVFEAFEAIRAELASAEVMDPPPEFIISPTAGVVQFMLNRIDGPRTRHRGRYHQPHRRGRPLWYVSMSG